MNIAAITSSVQNMLGGSTTGLSSQVQNLLGSTATGTASQTQNLTTASGDGTQLFKDVYNEVISNVTSTDSNFQGDLVKAAAGELDNPHQLLIDSEKANISLQFAISMRNKALESYNSIIGMQL